MRDSDAYSLFDIGLENKNSKTHDRIKRCETFRVKYQKNKKKFIFLVKCSESWSDPKGHIVSLKFDYSIPLGKEFNFRAGDVDARVFCSCPAFQYWGSAYTSTTLDYYLNHREFRFPYIRDPNLINTCCKHVLKVRHSTLETIRVKDLKSKFVDDSKYHVNKDSDIRTMASGELVSFEEFAIGQMESGRQIVSVESCNQAVRDFLTRSGWSDEEVFSFLNKLDENNFESKLESIGMVVPE